MSHLARAPRSGIDSRANAAGGRHVAVWITTELPEADRMSHLARDPRSGIDSKANTAGDRREAADTMIAAAEVSA